MAWISIQFVIFPMNFMSIIFFIFGLAQAITGFVCWVSYRQDRFSSMIRTQPSDNVGTNPQELVVFFSRHGYVGETARRIAQESGAQLIEITTRERTDGTAGFWWCGRFGMHGWSMPINQLDIPIERYDCVTICTPIWVFAIAAPIREFCKVYAGRIQKANYVVVHFQNTCYRPAKAELDSLLGVIGSSFVSIRCRFGRFKSIHLE